VINTFLLMRSSGKFAESEDEFDMLQLCTVKGTSVVSDEVEFEVIRTCVETLGILCSRFRIWRLCSGSERDLAEQTR
jgi:hypothetical protein